MSVLLVLFCSFALVQGLLVPWDGVKIVADGRFEKFTDCGGNLHLRFELPGTRITTTFAGLAFGVQLGGEAASEFFVYLDGKKASFGGQDFLSVPASTQPKFIDLGAMLELREGLVHRIELVKKTHVGIAYFFGFEVNDPQLIGEPLVPLYDRAIDFIGGSAVCGHALTGAAGCSTGEQDPSASFGSIVARAFNAPHTLICAPGARVTPATEGADTLQDIYFRTLPSRKESKWTFRAFDPKVAVIDAGVADLDAGVAEADVKLALAHLMNQVYEQNPETHVGVFVCRPKLGAVCDLLEKQGWARPPVFLRLEGDLDVECPSREQHCKIAEELGKLLSSDDGYEWTAPSEFCPTNGAETYNPRDDGYCYGDQLQPTPRPPGAYIPEAERPPTPVKQVHGVCMHRNLCVDTQEWTIDEETEVSLPGCANAATVCCVPPMPFTCKAASGPAFCEPYTPKVALHPRLDVLPQTVETGDDCRDYVGPLPTASRDPPPGVAIRTDADSAAPAPAAAAAALAAALAAAAL